MSEAIRPDFITSQLPTLSDSDEKAEVKGATEEERALYKMSQTSGWKVWTEFMKSLMTDLDNLNKTAMATGASYEDLGRNALVVNLTKDIIESGLNKVQDAIEACEDGE